MLTNDDYRQRGGDPGWQPYTCPEELDPGYILIYGNKGPMPHEATMRSIELLGIKVIPASKEG